MQFRGAAVGSPSSSRVIDYLRTRLTFYQPTNFIGARSFGDLTEESSTTRSENRSVHDFGVYAGLTYGLKNEKQILQVISSTPNMLTADRLLGMELKRRSFEPVLGTPLEAIIAIDGNRAPFSPGSSRSVGVLRV